MYLILFLDKTTFDVVNHPLDTPQNMENFIYQELGKDIQCWRAMIEESKRGEIILETDYSKETGVTELARRYLSCTMVQELLTHSNTTH